MTNAEKYLKDGVDRQFLTDFSRWYYAITRDIKNVDTILAQFLSEKAQPTLTEDERVILRNVKWKGYTATHIGREKENKGSFIYIRFENDIEMTYFFDNFFGHLFQFIKERRRI